MNDFTKEELIFLHDLIHDYLICRECKVVAEELWEKIKSMIDNNCEHSSDNFIYYKTPFGHVRKDQTTIITGTSYFKCKKCGGFYQ